MFRLTKGEKRELVTNCDRFQTLKHSSALPGAFTEQGVAMLSSVLNNERAIQVNIMIMRAFVRLRKMLASHVDLSHKLEELEKKYDSQFRVVFDHSPVNGSERTSKKGNRVSIKGETGYLFCKRMNCQIPNDPPSRLGLRHGASRMREIGLLEEREKFGGETRNSRVAKCNFEGFWGIPYYRCTDTPVITQVELSTAGAKIGTKLLLFLSPFKC